jgi:ABC-type antimicrobial peptide transport system permease subunit
VLGSLLAIPVIWFLTRGFIALGVPLSMHVNGPTAGLSMVVALTLGLVSGYLPAYNASRMNIVDGLRHIG